MSNELFSAETVIVDVNVSSQKQLFQDIATRLVDAHALTDIASRDIVSAAMERERLGSTGVGNGVALPHARIAGLEKVVAARKCRWRAFAGFSARFSDFTPRRKSLPFTLST